MISNYFKQTNTLGFYRYFYARIMPYLLCKIIDTDSVATDEEMEYILKILGWFFNQKEEYKVAVINDRLEEIVDLINKNEYEKAIFKIKDTKKYRQTLNDAQKEKMYAPSEALYTKMSE